MTDPNQPGVPVSRARAELYLLSLTVVWGSTFALTKIVLLHASPFVYISLRFAVASLLFSALFFKRLRSLTGKALMRGAALGVLLFIGFVTQTVGLQYTSASKSAFITGMMVVFTPLFQLLIERRPPKLGNVIGVALVTVGLYLLTSPQGSEFTGGDALTLLCAIAFALYTVYLDIFGKKHDPAHLSFVQFLTTMILAAMTVPFLETPRLNLRPDFLAVLLYLAVLPTVVALYVMAKYQKYTTPTRSAIIYSIEPPVAAVFAYFILSEFLGILGVLGGILIVSGLIISELSDTLFRSRQAAKQRNSGKTDE
jgi:drug/metabolite transporter (DMT)-like permease